MASKNAENAHPDQPRRAGAGAPLPGTLATRTRALRAAAMAAGSVSFFWVLGSGLIRCPMNAWLHVPCPGCGSGRAGHALLSLDVVEALRTNPVAPFAIALMALLAVRAVYVVWRDGTLQRLGEGRLGELLTSALTRLVLVALVVWLLRMAGLFGGLVDQNV